MTDRTRARWVFLPLAGFAALYAYSVHNLPPWGAYRGPYGDTIARLAVYERHATDVVNAINYDYRAFDTLGEEFILFTAVLGVAMLLRRETQTAVKPAGRVVDTPPLSSAARLTTLPALLVTILFGMYIGLHGQLTPGGGFQAGVILATAPVLLYLCENTAAFRRITSHAAAEVIEAIGAGGYAVIGLVPLLMGAPLLTNVLPLGVTGDVFSSGTIALISVTVGVEVTCSFLMVIYAYLEEIITGEVPES
ncbi:hydrogen gas-evolving membrane-bound hydrogenase subunit E [Terriglobus aquaticus]|uniref:Hydrogen gas-evolving membrane-bound hydrogenase subunit E n=1 Tax=Terriglobus aquaticus TaxID=940139 RepID=A0ABW9KHQ2_9BACT|nr:hydrogen gas-evolving membrane-bound hydrogenase subunit E [Terriglobus aquaticus]